MFSSLMIRTLAHQTGAYKFFDFNGKEKTMEGVHWFEEFLCRGPAVACLQKGHDVQVQSWRLPASTAAQDFLWCLLVPQAPDNADSIDFCRTHAESWEGRHSSSV